MPDSQEFKMQQESTRKKSVVVSVLFFLLIFLVIVAGVLAYFLRRAQVVAEEQATEYRIEKDSIVYQLQNQVQAFDSLKSTSAEVQGRLETEKKRAEALVAELQAKQQVTFQQLKSYQRELGTLREIMRNMVHEIDSLNTANRELLAENSRMRGSYAESQQQVRQLTSSNEELSTAVMRGSVVKARNIAIVPLNKKQKLAKRASKTVLLRTDLTLSENALAKPGKRTVYIRLTDRDGILLPAQDGATFSFGGQEMPCSAHREIDYQNQDVDMQIFYGDLANTKFISGDYHVAIFMDETLIGEGSLTLK